MITSAKQATAVLKLLVPFNSQSNSSNYKVSRISMYLYYHISILNPCNLYHLDSQAALPMILQVLVCQKSIKFYWTLKYKQKGWFSLSLLVIYIKFSHIVLLLPLKFRGIRDTSFKNPILACILWCQVMRVFTIMLQLWSQISKLIEFAKFFNQTN